MAAPSQGNKAAGSKRQRQRVFPIDGPLRKERRRRYAVANTRLAL